MVQTRTRDYVANPTTRTKVSKKRTPKPTEKVTNEVSVGSSENNRKEENGTVPIPSERRRLTSLPDQTVNNLGPRTPLQQPARGWVVPGRVQWNPGPKPNPNRPPHLILLPPEIKLMIISYVKNKRVWHLNKPEGPTILEPSLRCLRMVHRSYRCLIPHRRIKAKTQYDRADMLLMAEDYYPSTFAKNLFPCYGCLNVFDIANFTFEQTHCAYVIGEEKAHYRRCKSCQTNDLNKVENYGPKWVVYILNIKRRDRDYGKQILARFGSRGVREANWQRQKDERAADCGVEKISS